jgi:hypothetical protein
MSSVSPQALLMARPKKKVPSFLKALLIVVVVVVVFIIMLI